MKYQKLFAEASLPDPKNFQGDYAVKYVHALLPADIRFFGHKKHLPPDISIQGGGFNCFLELIKLGTFRIETGPSVLGDGMEVMKIIYDDPSNPQALKWLTDEVREVRPGFHICRGIYTIMGKPLNIMYFTLEQL